MLKKHKWGNVSQRHPIKTKNLTIQIMENKERYHNAKRAFCTLYWIESIFYITIERFNYATYVSLDRALL